LFGNSHFAVTSEGPI
jgi:hypothetical protein